MTLLRLICQHRVVVHDRGRLVCQTCGASLAAGEMPRGRHALLRRAHRA
jgi:hypothetical protein